MRGRQRQAAALAVAAALIFSWPGVREAASGKAPDGAPCAAPAACQSGFCADGVCCGAPCNAPGCVACAVAAGASADGVCTLLDGPPCDDHNPCTQADRCAKGLCLGGQPVVCAAPDPCHEAYCDPAIDGGGCASVAAPDGTPCDDHDVCTQTDTCHGGACVGAGPVTCPLQADCHTPGACDPAMGCLTKSAPACGPPDGGAAPDPGAAAARADGRPCAGAGDCRSGFCVAGVCCDAACTATCHSCALPDTPGTCTPEPEGVDLGHACGDEGTCLRTCGPHGVCVSSGPGTQCAPPRCIDAHRGLGPAGCTSYGAPCPTEASVPFDCAPYLCVAALGACAPAKCRSVHDCAPGHACGADHSCGRPPDLGGGDDGGCGCRIAPPPPPGAPAVAALSLLAALGRRRPARRRGDPRR